LKRVDDERFEIDLDPVLRAAGEARQAAQAWLAGLRFPCEWLDDLLLIVSELVTNAVIHAETRLRLVIHYDGRRVLTEVFDGDPRLPVRADETAQIGGRGLFIVERLSNRWGSDLVGGGKRVWAELAMRA
jgi:anti-sigma regulatory factor (Ser/Thr protein kinase)